MCARAPLIRFLRPPRVTPSAGTIVLGQCVAAAAAVGSSDTFSRAMPATGAQGSGRRFAAWAVRTASVAANAVAANAVAHALAQPTCRSGHCWTCGRCRLQRCRWRARGDQPTLCGDRRRRHGRPCGRNSRCRCCHCPCQRWPALASPAAPRDCGRLSAIGQRPDLSGGLCLSDAPESSSASSSPSAPWYAPYCARLPACPRQPPLT